VTGYRTKFEATTVNSLTAVQTANAGSNSLGGNATFTGDGCDAGFIIDDILYHGRIAIAQLMANYLNRGVKMYAVGTYFSRYDSKHDITYNGNNRLAPTDLPVYLIPDGAPGNKPDPIPFTPK
jgi:hypothetical protein